MTRIINNRDNVYVNLILQNEDPLRPSINPVFAATKEYNLDIPIIDHASEYYLQVESMTCSLTNIPVFIPDIQPNLPPYFNTDINKTIYSFTMSYNGQYSDETFVTFIPQGINVHVAPLMPFQDRTSSYYQIFTYTIIVTMLNNALEDCLTNLASKITLPVGSTAPYFYYDEPESKFCLVAQKDYYDILLALPIEIYCNYQLYEIINSIPFSYLPNQEGISPAPGVTFQLIVSDLKNNLIKYPNLLDPTGDYYVMKQNESSIASISPLKSLYVSTNNIPVGPQISPLKPTEENKAPNKVNKAKIILDIEPLILGNLVTGRNYIQYRALTNEYIDLLSDNPIQQLDVSFYWRDRFGNSYQVYLNYNQPANIRFLFINKNIV